ncbi:hypothetical protein L7F22_039193 [Adiantum nelumboides]|nr:hypothetical protein [Adiantum nelumboides]
MTSMLAILRLGLIRRYRQRAGIESKTKDMGSDSENVKAPLLQSLLGLIHYASFSAHLHVKLTLLTKLYPNVQLDMNTFERMGDVRSWLTILLQQSDKIGNLKAIQRLGGSGTIFFDGKPFAYLSFAYPSQISLTLPLRKLSDGSGTGVNLTSVDLTSLEGILTKELIRLQGALSLSTAVVSAQTYANAEAQLYLHPSQSSENGLESQLTAPAFDEVLSKHLGVEDAISQLKDDVKQRTVILFSGMDNIDLATLIDDYGQRIFDAQTPTIAAAEKIVNFFENAAGEMESALESASNWVFGKAQNAAGLGKKMIDETDFAIDDVSRPFYQSLRNLVAYLDTIGSQEDDVSQSAYQALRFDGLQDIKASYGEESQQYQRAVQSLKEILKAAVDKAEAVHTKRPQALALVFVPRSEQEFVKRGETLTPFRGTIAHTPFLATRDLEEEVSNVVRQSPLAKSSDIPPESQLSGQCFTSEDDLNKATNKCSGRGKAIQSSKGGRKCYRCQCEKTNGKEWAGSACQRPDISKPFALLAVTTIGLILVAFWSILYLFNEGQQELPSVLAGISIPKKQL